MHTFSIRVQRCMESFLAASAAILLLLSVPCSAQLSSASVNGTVRDPKGAVIPGATVVLHNVETNVDHQVQSNGSGAYALLNVVPGKYTLEARASGFNPQRIEQFALVAMQNAAHVRRARLAATRPKGTRQP